MTGELFGGRFNFGRPARAFNRGVSVETGGSVSFDPTALPSTAIWYDPSNFASMRQGTGNSLDLGEVDAPAGQIRDVISDGYVCAATSDNQRPILRADGAYNYLQFDGADDWLRCDADAFGAPIAQPNIICLAAYITPAPTSNRQIYGGITNSDRSAMQLRDGGEVRMRAGAWSDDVSGIIDTRPQVITVLNNSGASYIRIDGVETAVQTGVQNVNGLTLAASYQGSVESALRLYQFVVHAGDLTAQELSDLETFMASKSGAILA